MKGRSFAGISIFYVILTALAIGAYFLIEARGRGLYPMTLVIGTGSGATLHQFNHVLHVLLALAVVISAAQVVGKVFSYIHQPPVIGEVIGGILLGPSLLGKISPEMMQFLLPTSVAPFLG